MKNDAVACLVSYCRDGKPASQISSVLADNMTMTVQTGQPVLGTKAKSLVRGVANSGGAAHHGRTSEKRLSRHFVLHVLWRLLLRGDHNTYCRCALVLVSSGASKPQHGGYRNPSSFLSGSPRHQLFIQFGHLLKPHANIPWSKYDLMFFGARPKHEQRCTEKADRHLYLLPKVATRISLESQSTCQFCSVLRI